VKKGCVSIVMSDMFPGIVVHGLSCS
jgi:hypothetical protein